MAKPGACELRLGEQSGPERPETNPGLTSVRSSMSRSSVYIVLW